MIIQQFNIDLNYISNAGETRAFTVNGSDGGIFSLIVERLVGSTTTYYNFSTNTFVSSQKRLKNRKLLNGNYSGNIVFPAGGLSSGGNPNTYTLKLFAESAWNTTHAQRKEVRFPDGTLDVNSSTGSNSDLLQKTIYQFPETVVSLSAISPNSLSGFAGATVTTDTITVQRGKNTGKIPFTITCTLASTKAGVLKRNPLESDLTAFTARTLGEPVKIEGVTAKTETVGTINATVPISDTDKIVLAAIGSVAVGNTVTGLGINSDHPVVVIAVNPDGDNVNEIQINKTITVADNASHTTPWVFDLVAYRRWNCSQIQRLLPNMLAFSGGVSAGTKISGYLDTSTQIVETHHADGSISEQTRTYVNFDVPPLDNIGYLPVWTYGRLSTQQGLITFDTAQAVATNRNVGTKFYAYGSNAIKSLHNSKLKITDLDIEITDVTTTINDASADGATALNDFDVTSTSGILDDVSAVYGVNLTPSSVTPTVTAISSYNLTLTPGGHYVQNGQTLTFKGAGRVFTITGNIEFENIDDTDFTLRFDLEKFITAS